jgi:hypothetical protein
MQFAGGAFDSASSVQDAQASKTQGYRTADANETRIRARSAQQLGEQRAAAAQSGFDPNSGTLATLQEQSAGNAELDALTERYKGELNAWQQDLTIDRGIEKQMFVMNPAGALLGNKLGTAGKLLSGRYADEHWGPPGGQGLRRGG